MGLPYDKILNFGLSREAVTLSHFCAFSDRGMTFRMSDITNCITVIIFLIYIYFSDPLYSNSIFKFYCVLYWCTYRHYQYQCSYFPTVLVLV
jgi:hypothetical protein